MVLFTLNTRKCSFMDFHEIKKRYITPIGTHYNIILDQFRDKRRAAAVEKISAYGTFVRHLYGSTAAAAAATRLAVTRILSRSENSKIKFSNCSKSYEVRALYAFNNTTRARPRCFRFRILYACLAVFL